MLHPEGDLHWPSSLYWTCLLGLKSWAKLDHSDRKNWEFAAGSMKGLDLRDEETQCRSITQDADCEIRSQRRNALGEKVKGLKSEEIGAIVNKDLDVNPVTPEEWEAAIAHRAIEAYRQGYLLLAVVPDLHSDKAASLMARLYGLAQRKYAGPKQRARWEGWLPLVAAFEEAEITRSKQNSQEFVHYRRAIDGIRFE